MISFNIQRSFARCQGKVGRADVGLFEGGFTMLAEEFAYPSCSEDATEMPTTFSPGGSVKAVVQVCDANHVGYEH